MKNQNSEAPLDLLRQGLEVLGCGEIQSGLESYLGELNLWNPRYGLINASGDREILVKHFLDSLAPLSWFRTWSSLGASTLADIGSGAGLPGIPLSLALPGISFSLVEKQAKRVRFLENCRLMTNLKNVEILNENFEALDRKFDLVTFRAFTPLESPIVSKLLGLVAPGGHIAAYKGRQQTLNEELSSLNGLEVSGKPVRWEVHPLKVPFLEEERHLVILSV